MLDDILEEGLRIVFCGTAAGTKSAQLKQYYAGRGNKFWWVLAETGLTPRLLAPHEVHLLPRYGLGLTDLVKGQSGADKGIVFGASGSSGLSDKIHLYRPDILCFNGKRAAQEFLASKKVTYGLQASGIGDTRLFVAPSTSAAANGSWDLSVWQDLASLARE